MAYENHQPQFKITGVPRDMYNQVHQLASKKGIAMNALLKMWISEKLDTLASVRNDGSKRF